MNAEDKIIAFVQKENLIGKGDRILLGLSGGADSVCLFYLLLGLREKIGFELRAAHVHHGIRSEAEEDAACVQALCEKEGIRCHLFREDVPAYAREHGVGEEEAGRLLRYLDFEECLRQWQAEENVCLNCFKIATAHHEDDQAETVLFQLFRGCGLSGLRGILPMRGNVIRPLLCLSRAEIENFLQNRGISWREDHTNQSEEYSRNKIRHQILPYADSEICNGAAGHIAKTAEVVREAETYFKKQVASAYARTTKEADGIVVFDIPTLSLEDIFLRKQLLLYGMERLSAGRKNIGMVHVEDVLRLLEKQANGELSLPAGIKAQKCYQKLALFKNDKQGEKSRKEWQNQLSKLLSTEKSFLYGEEAPVLETERIDLADEESMKRRFGILKISEILRCIPEKTYTKWLDYDRIEMPFSIRHPESGDYLSIDGKMNRKCLRRYLMEEKIPASRRGEIWLLAAGSHVIWVPGGRISSYYKVTEQTRVILQVQICEGEQTEEKTWQNM